LKFKEKLKSKKFLITVELIPPKGIDISTVLEKIKYLSKSNIDAINVTDNQRASLRASSISISKIILEHGLEPILQIVSRDRNRIAIQSDLLGANILGIENILLLSGDYTSTSEYSNAKAVYDLDTIQLIKTVKLLESGVDLAGKKLKGCPNFCIGAVVNPTAKPNDLQILMLKKKIKTGVNFFQTQAIFDITAYKIFFNKIKHLKIKIIPGIILIKSLKFMNFIQSLPGMNIPENIINRISYSPNPLLESIKICSETIRELRTFADGVHIMAIGTEKYIPEILENSV
jgi:5,10-methylenetetrahydrofolate reductase